MYLAKRTDNVKTNKKNVKTNKKETGFFIGIFINFS